MHLEEGSNIGVIESGLCCSCSGVVADMYSTALCPGYNALSRMCKNGFDCLISMVTCVFGCCTASWKFAAPWCRVARCCMVVHCHVVHGCILPSWQ